MDDNKCLDFEKIDCYRFVGAKSFERYLQTMLQTDVIFDENQSIAQNVTLVCVHQDGERQLKVFPWNQLLVQQSERNDLVMVLTQLYGENWHDLCYANVSIPNDKITNWNSVLHGCVDFLTQMEQQEFYPVIVTIGNRQQPYLKIVSLK